MFDYKGSPQSVYFDMQTCASLYIYVTIISLRLNTNIQMFKSQTNAKNLFTQHSFLL